MTDGQCPRCNHPDGLEDFDWPSNPYRTKEEQERYEEAWQRHDEILRCRCECHGPAVLDVSDWDVVPVESFVLTCEYPSGTWGILTPFGPEYATRAEAERACGELAPEVSYEIRIKPLTSHALLRGGQLVGRRYGSSDRAWAVIGLYRHVGYPAPKPEWPPLPS